MPIKTSNLRKIFVILLLNLSTSQLLIASEVEIKSPPSSANKLKANDEVYREYMLTMTRQLGTTCVTCHNLSNFASSEKATFKVSKDHIRVTQSLIDNGFDGQNNKPKADCYMCHRGKLKPDYKEHFDPMIMEKLKKSKKQDLNKEDAKD